MGVHARQRLMMDQAALRELLLRKATTARAGERDACQLIAQSAEDKMSDFRN